MPTCRQSEAIPEIVIASLPGTPHREPIVRTTADREPKEALAGNPPQTFPPWPSPYAKALKWASTGTASYLTVTV